MNEWKPIETAPKDKPILGYLVNGKMTVIQWYDYGGNYGNWCVTVGGNYADSNDLYDEDTPRFWMELPEPPK